MFFFELDKNQIKFEDKYALKCKWKEMSNALILCWKIPPLSKTGSKMILFPMCWETVIGQKKSEK